MKLIQLNNGDGNGVPYAISNTPSAGKARGSSTTSETKLVKRLELKRKKELQFERPYYHKYYKLETSSMNFIKESQKFNMHFKVTVNH